jgi:hypothetical protein
MKCLCWVVLLRSLVLAQAEIAPAIEFPALRGTWTLDETAGRGRIAGLPLARTLTIATTATEILLKKDQSDDEAYRLDGTETVDGDTRRSAVPVADALAVTTRRTRRQRGYAFTNVITDAYSAKGDVLTVERRLDVVVQALASPDSRTEGNYGPGHLVQLQDPKNERQTIVYRRQAAR